LAAATRPREATTKDDFNDILQQNAVESKAHLQKPIFSMTLAIGTHIQRTHERA
jgi:hypothetical protein